MSTADEGQFRVIRKKGTEYAGSHEYDRKTSAEEGVYSEPTDVEG